MNSRGFSSWEAVVFLLISATLLTTLAGFSIQEFRTANRVYGTIQAGRLLDNIDFGYLPPGSEEETVITVPRGFQNPQLIQNGECWVLTIDFRDQTMSRELDTKPVFDPANLLEVPGNHRVLVWRERDSVLIKEI